MDCREQKDEQTCDAVISKYNEAQAQAEEDIRIQNVENMVFSESKEHKISIL